MKNKEDISLEIMKRVMAYERKKLRIWYEVVIFVLVVILLAEFVVGIDLFFDIQESPGLSFWWILGEDWETIKILSGSVLNILWEELPWLKIGMLFLTTMTFVGCLIYAVKRNKFKRIKAGQIREYDKKEK